MTIEQCNKGHMYLAGPHCPWCRITELKRVLGEARFLAKEDYNLDASPRYRKFWRDINSALDCE